LFDLIKCQVWTDCSIWGDV